MGKRSNFERRAADFYPTPRAAVVPLIPHLRGIRSFAEPCAGDGALVRHLESFGLRCVYAGDIRTGQDALALDHYGAVDAIITNPPYTRELMHRLIEHFQHIAPTWLLIDYDWSATKQAADVPAPLLGHRDTRPPEMDRGLEGHRQGQPRLVQIRYPGIAAALSSTTTAAWTRLFLHGAPESASNAASLTSRSDPVRGSARRRAGSAPIARGLALRLALRPHPAQRLNHRTRKCFATSDTPRFRGSRRKAGSCCLHSMAHTTVSTRC